TPVLRQRFSWRRLSMWPRSAFPRQCRCLAGFTSRAPAPTTTTRSSILGGPARPRGRRQGHSDLGQPALAPLQVHEGVDRDPAALLVVEQLTSELANLCPD